jgi:hypothetical protein
MLDTYVPTVLQDSPNPVDVGVRRLWAAVIQQAMDDIAGVPDWVDKYSKHHSALRRQRAEAWFRSSRSDCGSFVWICDILRLDPARLRKGVFRKPVLSGGPAHEIALAYSPGPAALDGGRALPSV